MMRMTKILLLAGGSSSEREISLRSGAAVQAALEQAGHSVTVLDPANQIADNDFMGYDAIFPVLHGVGGEDGVLQARLESLGIHTFVGSNAASSALCFDKWKYKELLASNNILTASGALVNRETLRTHPLAQLPFVLKPNDGGSSVDTFIIRDVISADFDAMESACDRYGNMLIETLIEGTEITVGVFGDRALPVIEIIPPADGEFDYENKYNGKTQELCPPLHVSDETQTLASGLALQIHRLCACRDFSRTDMMIAADGSLYVLETNTIPGMTDESLLPKAAATAGIDMSTLCTQLVAMAATRS